VTSPIRVLHVPDSVGGNAPGLARAERKLGIESISVVLHESPFGYRPDRVLRPARTSRARYEARRAALVIDALREFDVVHFNFGRTIAPPRLRQLDMSLLRRAGRQIFVTFQGDDARRGDVARARGGLSLPAVLPERYPPASDGEKAARIRRFDRHAAAIYFLNPDLSHSLPPRAKFMPYAHVDPIEWEAQDRARTSVPVIVHAPSDRAVKGTSLLTDAVTRLRSEGIQVDLRLVEGLRQSEARHLYAKADLAVDQLFAGWYGGFAVEAMALGVPVVSYIREDDLDAIPPAMRADLPIIRAEPSTIIDVLRSSLTTHRAQLNAVGVQSRQFVERWHDPLKIATQLVADYRTALFANGVPVRERRT
jgi:hypothetical protein